MISVICPCYNSEKYIEQTIQCLLDQIQVNFKFEVIFIDDGSTDQTLNILKKSEHLFSEKKIIIKIKSQNNCGAGAARNIGIEYAQFNYIAFLDADDYWVANKLQTCHDLILKNPSYNIFSHNEIYKKLDGTDALLKNGLFEYDDISKSLYIKNTLSTSSVILHKDLLKTYGYFDVTLKSSQDYDLWLKLAPGLKPFHIDLTLGEYIEIEDSITSKYYFFRFLDQMRIAFRHRKYVNIFFLIKKLSKILFSKQWIFGIFNSRKHGF